MSDQKAAPREPIPPLRSGIEDPPTTIGGIVRRLGPGLIIAGAIVGSGELIATTATGAEAGFWLLWLILIGCVIKVFVQVEFGRYAVVRGKTTMEGMDEVPGPRLKGRGNWLVWYFLVMFLAGLAQLGGIVGGVGQALQISAPITEDGRRYNQIVDARTTLTVKKAEFQMASQRTAPGGVGAAEVTLLAQEIADIERRIEQLGELPEKVYDDRIWAAIITVVTAVLLVVGRYGLIQSFSAAMVATFTLITIINLFMLQSHENWSVGEGDIIDGLRFRLPPKDPGSGAAPLATALATFGIIGVGASELIAYPYWCLEKGYARFTGPHDETPQWADRARGWMRVMRYDAWCSMFLYTFATIVFYLLGAAILGRTGLNPGGTEMIRTLSTMYEPVFGRLAQWLFLFGAFAVLYSTFFVATAGHARVFPDALRVLGIIPHHEQAYRFWIRLFSGLFPFICLTFYLFIQAPKLLVLTSALMQAIMLPMLAAAALYLRYQRCDRRIVPGTFSNLLLWISAAGMLIAGVWAAWEALPRLWEEWQRLWTA